MKLPGKTVRLCAYLLLFKIVYLGLLSAVLLLWPVDKNGGMFPGAMLCTTSSGALTFASHFVTWDAEHYLILSETGYQKGIAQCAFYPLWPFLVRWFSIFIGGSHVISGMILANVFSLAGWLIFFQMISKRLGESVARLSVIFMLAFPGALFFQFVYSESLFFFLLMLLCYGLEQNRFWLALAMAFLLPLTKGIGVFCIFPIVWHLLLRTQPSWRTKLQNWSAKIVRPAKLASAVSGPNDSTGMVHFNRASYWLALAPLCGWAVYFTLMWTWTGNPFEGIAAQKQWGNVESIGNIFNPPKFIIGFFNPTCWHGFTGSTLDRIAFVILTWFLPVIWRLDKGWFVWTVVLGIVPAMSGTFTSLIRFEALVFPLFIAMAVFLSRPKLRWLCWLTLGVFGLLHLILLWRFVNFRWAG